MLEVNYDHRCFGCGELNPDGLAMRFENLGASSVCDYSVPTKFQSWEGIVHGGVVSLMLDEAVGWAAWHAGHPGVTAKLDVRLRQPLRVGETVRVTGKVTSVRHKLIQTAGTIQRLSDGALVAEATATLMETPTAVRT